MRTSLEIPDPLFKAAKRLAVERDTTLKALVTEGLQLVIGRSGSGEAGTRPDSARLPKVSPVGKGTYSLTSVDIEQLLAEEEAARYGRGR